LLNQLKKLKWQIEANKLDNETIESIREAIESYQSENNIVVRSKFEEYESECEA
jgi:hypothetical protein